MSDDKPKWLDPVGAFVLLCLTIMFCIVTVGPYFGLHPATDDANQKAVVNNLFIAVVSFFVGGSVQSRKKDDTANTAINIASKAQDALTPNKTPDVTLNPGDKKVIAAADTNQTEPQS